MPRTILFAVVLFGLAAVLAGAAAAQRIVKQEPPLGKLREGEMVLVDDGACGPGKIKQVIGGNHVRVGGTKQILRAQRCIERK